MKMRWQIAAGFALACALMAGTVELGAQTTSPFDKSSGGSGQAYPSKTVRVIVPFPAGGGADIIGRALAQKLGESFGQQFIVDNRAGAFSSIGTELAARAVPDGYTLLIIGPNHASNPHLMRKISYDAIKDFAPISLLTSASYILIVHPSLPVRSVKDLIALARARPGQIDYGSGGTGTASHLGMELFKMMANIDMQHVPYKGGPAMLTDVLGGQIQVGYDNILTTIPQLRAGRLRALAVSGARRTPSLPELPTMAEAGLPGYDIAVWQGVLAPAGTPEAIIARLHEASVTAMQKPEMRESMLAKGADVVTNTPQEFRAFIRTELEKAGQIVRKANVRLD
jgi:tripartite-type tricarboxylate transporter receptor subunit TctC